MDCTRIKLADAVMLHTSLHICTSQLLVLLFFWRWGEGLFNVLKSMTSVLFAFTCTTLERLLQYLYLMMAGVSNGNVLNRSVSQLMVQSVKRTRN